MQTRKKRSIIWSLDVDELRSVVLNATSITEVLKHFNLNLEGGHHRALKQKLELEYIDFSHMPQGLGSNKGKTGISRADTDKYFCEESTIHRGSVKNYIRKNDLIPYVCSNCNLEPLWDNKELVLVLDHINGIHNDNRLENLRFLCPNCNSQTSTFAGRNVKRDPKPVKPSEINPNWNKEPRLSRRKVERPSKEELEDLLIDFSYRALSKKFGVSDNSIRKWAKYYGIISY